LPEIPRCLLLGPWLGGAGPGTVGGFLVRRFRLSAALEEGLSGIAICLKQGEVAGVESRSVGVYVFAELTVSRLQLIGVGDDSLSDPLLEDIHRRGPIRNSRR
jgi:hypothetical protein